MLIESLSGVRGYEDDLTAEVIQTYAYALRLQYGTQRVVIGRDSRPSGLRIHQTMAEALQRAGVDVFDLGICPTPTVQYAVTHLQVDTGIVITASHNPLPWNGIKLIGKDGMFLSGPEMERLRNLRLRLIGWQPTEIKLGQMQVYSQAETDHINSVLQLPYLQIENIKTRHFKVVVDAVNGAASHIIPQLLTQLGCEVICLYCDPTAPFPHTPEPLPENLSALCQQVKASEADLGLAIDPDGDRLAVISEKGEPISEEYTLVLALKLVLERSRRTPKIVVTNLSTTLAVDKVAQSYGAQVIRTPIGEINVARKMEEVGAVIGGEGNGGVILPEAHLGRDSLVATALILELLGSEQQSVSQLVSQLPRYYMTKRKIPSRGLDFADISARLLRNAMGASINRDDGLKLTWPDRWIHLRPSNTEPILRLYCEAPTVTAAEELAQKYSALLNEPLT